MPEKNVHQNLEQLIELAKRAGAEGIWLLRGPLAPSLIWYFDEEDTPNEEQLSQASARKVHGQNICTLELEETDLLVVLRFPSGDGGEPGIESR